MIAHCMFEQSGTFKNEFKKLGIEALDYVPLRTHNNAKSEDSKTVQTMRSMMHPQYARRFIKQYILPRDES